jgi:two-component system, NarL family, invasion response regulator UvrY
MKDSNDFIKIALVDDHVLLRTALASLINKFEDCKVVHQSGNGKELTKVILSGLIPDIIILDLNMPHMDGHQTALWLNKHYPDINVLMLTMFDSELSLIRLLQCGVKGFVKKDAHPRELKFAITSITKTGFYYSHNTTGKVVRFFEKSDDGVMKLQKATLTDEETMFFKLICSDLTYKEIAARMNLNHRTVDTMRDHLFTRLDVRSRVGLVMIAIKHGIVSF